MCKEWVGKGVLHHYAFKKQSVCALRTNQGAVIDESPELRLNQRLTHSSLYGQDENSVLLHQQLLLHLPRGSNTHSDEEIQRHSLLDQNCLHSNNSDPADYIMGQ